MKQNLSNAVIAAADRAVFGLQYNTNKAAQFVCSEVPATSFEMAVQAIDMVARPQRSKVSA